MADIFGTDVKHGGAWKLDGAIISLAKGNDDLIVNTCSINYNRPINKINPLNTNKQFLVAGRGNGTVNLGIVVGPSSGIKTFIEEYADPCKVAGNVLTIKAANISDCPGDDGIGVEFVCKYCLLQGINASVQAGDLSLLSAGTSLIIGGLEIK
jgi:hypothetical protein